MNTKISDLTIDELKNLISSIVHETMEDFLEDLKALSSKDYMSSIKEAREDYQAGDVKNFNEVF
jgi:glutamyl-tRNA reductase